MDGSCLEFRRPISDAISRIRFAPRANNLLISSWDSNLRLYDVDNCELSLEAPSEGAALLDCCFACESIAVSADSDGSILRYDLHVGNSKAMGNHDDLATCVEYSEESGQIVTGGWDKKVKFWDARSISSLRCLSNLGAEIESISLSGYSLMVAAKSLVNLYDIRFLDKLVQAKEPFTGIHIKCVRSSSDLEGFLVGLTDGRIALEFLDESDPKKQGYAFRCCPKDKNAKSYLVAVNDIAFDPSTRGVLVTGDNDGNSLIWDVLNKKRLTELPRCPNSVASLAYNHSGQLLAVASSSTYHEANRRNDPPRIFLHHMDDT